MSSARRVDDAIVDDQPLYEKLCEAVYSADKAWWNDLLRPHIALAVWNSALEEAAKLADGYSGEVYPDMIAEEIRKLKRTVHAVPNPASQSTTSSTTR